MLAHFLQVMLQQIKLGTGSCCCLLDVSAEFSDKLNQPVLKEANGSLASGLAAGGVVIKSHVKQSKSFYSAKPHTSCLLTAADLKMTFHACVSP